MSIMNRIILATRNAGKIREIKDILSDIKFEILSMEEVGIKEEIEETGNTYSENALIKAMGISKILGEMVVADDSGLEVNALNNRPGVFSARYATGTEKRIEKLLDEMQNIPFEKRRARFVCVVCLFMPNQEYHFFDGRVDGLISIKPSGENGFGFDPVFYIPQFGKTMAELPNEIKNKISHRAIAFKRLKDFLCAL